MGKGLTDFLATYTGPSAAEVLLDVELSTADPDQGRYHPMIIVRYGDYVVVLELRAIGDHLGLDAHPFVGGDDARIAAFGMENSRRWEFDPVTTQGTSQDLPAAAMVALLVGTQAGRPLPPAPDQLPQPLPGQARPAPETTPEAASDG